MPRWAAPKATKVATSKLRTRMMSRSGWLVVKRSWRASGSAKAASGSMPACASKGAASRMMRPLGSARINFSFASLATPDLRPFITGEKCPPPGSLDRMGGLPRGRPRLPDILQMAHEAADIQPDGPACGEAQRDAVGPVDGQSQQLQHAVGLVQGHVMVVNARHIVEDDCRVRAPV